MRKCKVSARSDGEGKMAKQCRFFKEFWKSPEDPNYALLELAVEEVEYLKPGEILVQKYKV